LHNHEKGVEPNAQRGRSGPDAGGRPLIGSLFGVTGSIAFFVFSITYPVHHKEIGGGGPGLLGFETCSSLSGHATSCSASQSVSWIAAAAGIAFLFVLPTYLGRRKGWW
jgi:hypothetical protein